MLVGLNWVIGSGKGAQLETHFRVWRNRGPGWDLPAQGPPMSSGELRPEATVALAVGTLAVSWGGANGLGRHMRVDFRVRVSLRCGSQGRGTASGEDGVTLVEGQGRATGGGRAVRGEHSGQRPRPSEASLREARKATSQAPFPSQTAHGSSCRTWGTRMAGPVFRRCVSS